MNAILVFSLRLVLLLLCYLFLGWIVFIIYKDLKKESSDKQEKVIPPIDLTFYPENEELSRRFRQPEVFLGRDPAIDFTLENETVSLQHCKLSFHQQQWWAEDLKSTNGTYLNNTLITTATVLTDGDTLRLGNAEILININQNFI